MKPTWAALACLTVTLTATAAEPEQHWSFKPPVRPSIPAVADAAWCRNPIDRFILARLDKEGFKPSSEADRLTLLRRVTFDVTGLPPTAEDVAKPQAAYEALVERLLASPAYGERWGRHWLDLARYADSNGYEFDEVRPDAWRYRDYVIDSLNADKPYDLFLKEQLAGDELFPDDPDALVATGFNLLGPDMTDSADQKQRRLNTLNDMTDTAGLVFMGLTLACARCHDHKFEPISIQDYYRFQAFFAPATFRRDLPVAAPEQRAAFAKAKAEYDALVKPTRDEIAELEKPYRDKLYQDRYAKLADAAKEALNTPVEKRTAAQKDVVEKTARLLEVPADAVAKALSETDKKTHQELQAKLKTFDDRKPTPLPTAMGLSNGPLVKTFVLERGELKNVGEEVKAGYPTAVATDEPPEANRATLAAWLTRPDHPLTARVVVNRLWQHHFGRGLVATGSDFGLRGSRPTHPELLDWLATELVASGWSLKHIHQLMLTSATYRQASAGQKTPDTDPENVWLWRMNRRRLEGEAVRDALLAVSGRLSLKMRGPGVLPPLPEDVAVKGWTASADPKDHVRRSVYIQARRNLRYPFLEAFDLPDSNLSCPRRERSTTAPQALSLLNSADATTAARAVAAKVMAEGGTEDEQAARAFHLILSRPPSPTESRAAVAYLKQSPLSELCRALLNVNEFVWID